MNSLLVHCLIRIKFAEFRHFTIFLYLLYATIGIHLDLKHSKDDRMVVVQVKVATSPKFELFGYDFMVRIGTRVGIGWACC